MASSHLIRPKTKLMVAFLLIDIIGMSVHHSHFSACHSLRSVIKTKATEFIRHRTNFRPAEKVDRTLYSHGTVQSFRAVHTEQTNQVEFNFFFVSSFTICKGEERYYSKSKLASPSLVTTLPCNRVFAVRNFRRLWRSHLADQIFRTKI